MADTNNPSVNGLGKTQGRSGTWIFSGIITQEEYNHDLIGLQGKKKFDIMRRSDSSIHATLQVCKLPILSTTWDIEPASEDENDQYIARFVENELMNRNVNFHDFMREALTMFDFGFSVFEKTYELTEFEGKTRVGIQELGSRKQRSILYWETKDHQPGVQQQLLGGGVAGDDPTGLINIPMPKLIVFTNEKEGTNYEGFSLLRFAYKDWDIKDKLTLVHAIALEKMAMGIPVITPPATVNPVDQENARTSVRQMRANEESFAEKPNGWGLEMLDMKGQTTKDILPTLEYLDKQISKSVLAQFLELGSGGKGGSKALSQDHSQLFMLSEEAAAKTVASAIQHQLIKQMVDMNFSDLPNGYPKIKNGKIGDDDITVLATAVSSLMTAKAITPDPNLEDHLRDTMHLPALAEEIHEYYDKVLDEDPDKLYTLPGAAPASPFGAPQVDPNNPTPPTPPAVPKPNDKSIVDDPNDKEKTKAHRKYRRQLIQDVMTEFAHDVGR